MKILHVKANMSRLFLGRRGENLARALVFDVGDWVRTYGDGTIQVLHQRAQDTAPYPCAVTREGNLATWVLTAADTAQNGYGKLELHWYLGEVHVKSCVYITEVAESLTDDTADPPEAQQGWVDQVLEAAKVAAVLPDWNENDPDSPAYIKNRPFYKTEEELGDTIYDGTVTATEDELGEICAYIPSGFAVTVGNRYQVTLDGESYEVTAQACAGGGWVLGDLQESPFELVVYSSTAASLVVLTAGTYELTVTAILAETVTPLPEKYLPACVLTKETDPTVPDWAKQAEPPTNTFIATYAVTPYADILAAYNAGKLLGCYGSAGKFAWLKVHNAGSGRFEFSASSSNGSINYVVKSDDSWSTATYTHVMTTREICGKALTSDILLVPEDLDLSPIVLTATLEDGSVVSYTLYGMEGAG